MINNFGSKKTGWLTHKPIKVDVRLTGDISYAKEKLFSKPHKLLTARKKDYPIEFQRNNSQIEALPKILKIRQLKNR